MTAVTDVEYKWEIEPHKRDVFCEDFLENWPYYSGITVYIAILQGSFSSKCTKTSTVSWKCGFI